MSVLGENGLRQLVSNIKQALNGKSDTGHTHSLASLGAAARDHTHTAADIGAAASSHNHAAGNITSGTLGVARGGTGASTLTSGSYLIGNGTSAVSLKTPAQVLSDIGAAASSHNHAASAINSGTLSVARGGTGAGTLTSGSYIVGNGTSAVSFKTPAQVLTDIGAAPTSHTHSYVPLAGGTMTGSLNVPGIRLDADSNNKCWLRANTTNRNAMVLQVYGAGDANGDGVVIGDGGVVILGSGESHNNLYDALVTNGSWSNGSESTVIGADSSVYIMPNCQTVAERKEWQFTTGAELVGPNGGNFCPNGTNGQVYITTGEDSNGKKMQFALSGANTAPSMRLYDGSAWGSWASLSLADHTHSYLPLSGGTITGNLNRKNANMDTSAASLSAQQYSIIGFTDTSDRYVSYLQASENTSGTSLLDVAVRRYNSSANQTHYFRMGMDKSSNAAVSFSHPAAWRSGLGVAPVQLYNNTGNGINTAVSLSDSVANYTRIKIYFKDNNHKKCPCQEFYGMAASDTFSIYDVEASSVSTTYVRRTYYTVSSNGKTLTPSLGGDFGVNHSTKVIGAATTTATNELYIYRVEGYGY